MWKIRAYLAPDKFIDLGDVRSLSPGWSTFNPSGICRIEFPFESADLKNKGFARYRLILSNMNSYNFFVEAAKNILSNSTEIKGLWFLGKLPDGKSVCGFKIGKTITPIASVLGKEYNGFSTVGWKPGVLHGAPISTIVRE